MLKHCVLKYRLWVWQRLGLTFLLNSKDTLRMDYVLILAVVVDVKGAVIGANSQVLLSHFPTLEGEVLSTQGAVCCVKPVFLFQFYPRGVCPCD